MCVYLCDVYLAIKAGFFYHEVTIQNQSILWSMVNGIICIHIYWYNKFSNHSIIDPSTSIFMIYSFNSNIFFINRLLTSVLVVPGFNI